MSQIPKSLVLVTTFHLLNDMREAKKIFLSRDLVVGIKIFTNNLQSSGFLLIFAAINSK